MKINAYAILGIIIFTLFGVSAWLFVTGNAVIKAVLMFGMTGAVISGMFIIIIIKKLYPSLYPVIVRVYVERYDGLTVIEQTRAKVVKDKKGYEYLMTPSGKKYKMPDRKYVIKGKSPYVDIFDTKIQQFPVSFDKNSIKEMKKEVISENQRAWFADQVIPNIKEITKPPLENKIQMIAAISLISVVIIFVMGMAMGPDFMTKMNDFWQKRFAELEKQNEAFYEKLSESPIQVTCVNGQAEVTKPKPPPS